MNSKMTAGLGYEQEDVGFYITDEKGLVIVSCDTSPTAEQLNEINARLAQPAALAREAALREELAITDQYRVKALAALTDRRVENEALQQRLTAAEQRNAELIKHLTQAHRFVEATEWSTRSGIAMVKDHPEATWNIDESKAALNHKPEAASHES